MEVDPENTETIIQVSNDDFFKSVCDMYLNICKVDKETISPAGLPLLNKLFKEISPSGYNNIYELAYFFALSKKFYEKEGAFSFDEKICFLEHFVLNFIILLSLTKCCLLDAADDLKDYFVDVLYCVYFNDDNVFWSIFDKYCYVEIPAFARCIYNHDYIYQHCYKKRMFMHPFWGEYILNYGKLTTDNIEKFLKEYIFNTIKNCKLFFKNQDLLLLDFLQHYVYLRENTNKSKPYKFDGIMVVDTESIFAAKYRVVLNLLEFELYVSPEEVGQIVDDIEQIRNLFYVQT